MTTMNADCAAPYYYTDRLGNFYRSIDEGNTWSLRSAETGAIIVKSNESNKIRRIDPRNTESWNTDSGTWESTNGGSTWTQTAL